MASPVEQGGEGDGVGLGVGLTGGHSRQRTRLRTVSTYSSNPALHASA